MTQRDLQVDLQVRRARLAILLLFGAALAACVAVLLWGAKPALATYPGQNGRIAFEGGGTFGTDIFATGPTGTSQLTQTMNFDEYNPSYSADGSKVVFDTDRDGNQEIYTMDADGSNQTRLTEDSEIFFTFDGEPAFSPDGSEVVFARYNDKGRAGVDHDIDIYTMAPRPRATPTRVVQVPGIDEQPSFKPDDSRILFVNHGNGSVIYVVDRDGNNLTPLAEGHDPAWSPDGNLITFEHNGQVFLMNADGSNQQAIVDGYEPTFSPDCTRIAYNDSTYSISSADLSGGDEQTVYSSSSRVDYPDWQPLAGAGSVDCAPLPPPPPTPQISIDDVTVMEGDAGTTTGATFTVTLSDPSSDTVTVNYDTIDGTATQPDDYQQTSGTLAFAPGEQKATFTVPVNGDATEEGDEAFSVLLWSPVNAELARDTGFGTIIDDDASPANEAPLATDDSYTVDEDGILKVSPPGVLGNDTDADGDSLTAAAVTSPSYGNLALGADGSVSYKPNQNFFGSDSFTYRVNDGTDDSNVATVSITVNPVNDAPVARVDAYSVNFGKAQNTALSVPSPGVLANDTDVDPGDILTAILLSSPTNGTLQDGRLNQDGSFAYTPRAENFNGQATFTDSFTYKASDGTADSTSATVKIAVGRECTITGTPNSDSGKTGPTGTAGPDVMCGLAGNDTIRGADGDDLLFGDQGGDTLKGENGNDRIVARDNAADTIDCGAGTDTVLSFDQSLDKLAKNCENQLPRG